MKIIPKKKQYNYYEKKGYLGNTQLKPTGVPIEFTKEEIAEYIKCSEDPIYFIKTYVKIVNVDRGLIPFELYDYEERLVESLITNRFVIGKLPRQSGKCLYTESQIQIRNKKTGEIKNIEIGKFFEMIKENHNI